MALDELPRTRTQILMNIGNPEDAFSLASLPNDGVGLARLEFIIANHIQAHPLALIHFDTLKDAGGEGEARRSHRASTKTRPDSSSKNWRRELPLSRLLFIPNPWS